MCQPSFICPNRHGTYYFRFVIPLHLRLHFPNRREVRRSLKTDIRRMVVIRARAMRVHFDQLVEQFESMGQDKPIRVDYAFNLIQRPDGKIETKAEIDGAREDHQGLMEAISSIKGAGLGCTQPTPKKPPCDCPPPAMILTPSGRRSLREIGGGSMVSRLSPGQILKI